MKTTMQDLKQDLLNTIPEGINSLQEIKQVVIRKACISVLEQTINNIVKRIDGELLQMEEDQIRDSYNNGWQYGFLSGGDELPRVKTKNSEEYYNETFSK